MIACRVESSAKLGRSEMGEGVDRDRRSEGWRRAGRLLALFGFLVAVAVGAYLSTAESWGTTTEASVSVRAGTTVISYSSERPERNSGNEDVMKFWAAVLALVALVGLLAAFNGLTTLVWVVGGSLSLLSFFGLWSIGMFIAAVARVGIQPTSGRWPRSATARASLPRLRANYYPVRLHSGVIRWRGVEWKRW